MILTWVEDAGIEKAHSFKRYQEGKINRSCNRLDNGGKRKKELLG